MTGLMSTASRYAKAVRLLKDEDIRVDRVDDGFITSVKMRLNEIADRKYPSSNSASNRNDRIEYLNRRDLAVEMLTVIKELQSVPDTLSEANRAKVWDYHGDAME